MKQSMLFEKYFILFLSTYEMVDCVLNKALTIKHYNCTQMYNKQLGVSALNIEKECRLILNIIKH